jgi:STE24 endopeptidase
VNESRSTKYHRARRRAGLAALVLALTLLSALLVSGGSGWLRDAVRGSVSAYTLAIAVTYSVLMLPLTWYRSCRLEREYGLSHVSPGSWFRDYLKGQALSLALAVAAAESLYLSIRTWPGWWPIVAAAGGVLLLATLTSLAPVVILPLFHRFRPLARAGLRRRLMDLSARAGVEVLDVYEWGLGEKTRRANAALVGAGGTRRILLSDTLLSDYTDDEIEVILAHEMGHHAHRDVMKGLAAEFVVLGACLLTAKSALDVWWRPLGLTSPADPAGLPLVLIAAGGVSLAATPLLNALSRRNERRADRFAIDVTERPDAFIAAMRRMSAQNLAEEHPSRLALWFFHTHPTAEERIAAARDGVIRDRLLLRVWGSGGAG